VKKGLENEESNIPVSEFPLLDCYLFPHSSVGTNTRWIVAKQIYISTETVGTRKYSKRINKANLDEFELDILESVENGEWESKVNIAERTQELQSIIKHQNLIQMFIHQFTTDKIKFSF